VSEGSPDGIVVEVEDHLWVAVWGEGEVRRFAPDGSLGDRIDVAATNTSCLAFAGDDLRTLVITTASVELSEGSADPPGFGAPVQHSGRCTRSPRGCLVRPVRAVFVRR